MIIAKLCYKINPKRNGKNWILIVEHDGRCKYTETKKFVTKPKNKTLRKYLSMLREDVLFSKYWDEI